jgi:hypothetical protein
MDMNYVRILYHGQSDGKITVTYEAPYSVIKLPNDFNPNGRWVRPDILIAKKSSDDYTIELLKAIGMVPNKPYSIKKIRVSRHKFTGYS